MVSKLTSLAMTSLNCLHYIYTYRYNECLKVDMFQKQKQTSITSSYTQPLSSQKITPSHLVDILDLSLTHSLQPLPEHVSYLFTYLHPLLPFYLLTHATTVSFLDCNNPLSSLLFYSHSLIIHTPYNSMSDHFKT